MVVRLLVATIALAAALPAAADSNVTIVLRAVAPVSAGALDKAEAIVRARLSDSGLHASVKLQGSDSLAVTGPEESLRSSIRLLTEPGVLAFYDLEPHLAAPSRNARGSAAASLKPLRPTRGTTLVTCGASAIVCPGVSEMPPRHTYYYLF